MKHSKWDPCGKQVEIQLGTPVATKSMEDGKKEDTYRFEMGNSPNGARATLYFYYDLITIALAEPIFSLIEVFQGHTEESRVTYDAGRTASSSASKGIRRPQPAPIYPQGGDGGPRGVQDETSRALRSIDWCAALPV